MYQLIHQNRQFLAFAALWEECWKVLMLKAEAKLLRQSEVETFPLLLTVILPIINIILMLDLGIKCIYIYIYIYIYIFTVYIVFIYENYILST